MFCCSCCCIPDGQGAARSCNCGIRVFGYRNSANTLFAVVGLAPDIAGLLGVLGVCKRAIFKGT